jgi:hypothetical protein
LAEGYVEPRWWATQNWDPRKNSAFQARWGWTSKGALKIPGFDSEYWQRKATRSFYLRPYFVYDTIRFTLSNPYFMRHIVNLGVELLPMYKLRNMLNPSRQPTPLERENMTARCPSASTWVHEPRKVAAPAPAGTVMPATLIRRPAATKAEEPSNVGA